MRGNREMIEDLLVIFMTVVFVPVGLIVFYAGAGTMIYAAITGNITGIESDWLDLAVSVMLVAFGVASVLCITLFVILLLMPAFVDYLRVLKDD